MSHNWKQKERQSVGDEEERKEEQNRCVRSEPITGSHWRPVGPMAENRRPVSEHLIPGRRPGSDSSTEELWAPILSLSKSSTEVEASQQRKLELAWAIMDLPKSFSSAVSSHRDSVLESRCHQRAPTQRCTVCGPEEATYGSILESSQGGDLSRSHGELETSLLFSGSDIINNQDSGHMTSGSSQPKQLKANDCLIAWGERNHSSHSRLQCDPQSILCRHQADADGRLKELRSLLQTSRQLVSSISETGLDARQKTSCCQQGSQAQSSSFPGPQLSQPCRDIGTMTSQVELRHVMVQTGDPDSPQSVFSHELSSVGEARVRTSGAGSLTRELSWDSSGMTWDTYGASVDPKELSLAIQKHLGLEVNETAASHDSEPNKQDAPAPTLPQSESHKKKGHLKRSGCCIWSSTVGD
ncbi:G protein-regulated inducer of neurite outgrowth 2-like [Arapaima gigas]